MRVAARRLQALCTLTLIILIVCAPLASQQAQAQSGDLRSRGLNPFPKDDIYRLHFVGDWLMKGLMPSLKDSLKTVPRVQVQGEVIELLSLRRNAWKQNIKAITQRAKSTDIDMAIVMFGTSEIGSVFTARQERQRFGSEGWLKKYATRVDSIMKALKATKGTVYWIGLPVVRRRDHSEGFQLINTLIRERAYANGVTFIDVYSRFQDENGGFNRYGPDLDGTIKLLRAKDGVYFTSAGNAKIAHLVLQMVRRDLGRVKSERVVTLAGTETEQSSVRRSKEAPQTTKSGSTTKKKATQRIAPGNLPGGARFGAQKSDNGSFEYRTVVGNKSTKVTLKLPRPALSAAIMTLVTRNQSKDKPARFGDNAVQIANGGIPLLSTVTPADQSALALRKRRLSPTQSVFFKVWGKGERLPSKHGRADDFQWPRPEPKPIIHVGARKASVPDKRSTSVLAQQRDPNLPPLPSQNPYR